MCVNVYAFGWRDGGMGMEGWRDGFLLPVGLHVLLGLDNTTATEADGAGGSNAGNLGADDLDGKLVGTLGDLVDGGVLGESLPLGAGPGLVRLLALGHDDQALLEDGDTSLVVEVPARALVGQVGQVSLLSAKGCVVGRDLLGMGLLHQLPNEVVRDRHSTQKTV